ncbi:MAG: alpha/beta fold hydrolase [Rhizomicrobium sp.]
MNRWIRCQIPRPEHEIRLICFPNAGAGANAFATWGRALPARIEVCAVELPGRWTRIREPLYTRFDDLSGPLRDALEPLCRGRFAFLGYSMGGLLAFELTRRLCESGAQVPEHLFVVSTPAPGARPAKRVSHLDTTQMMNAVARNTGRAFPAELGSEMTDLLVPILRADLAVAESYHCENPRPLPVPISAFAGKGDPAFEDPVALSGWRSQTMAGFNAREYRGDHFVLDQHRDDVMRHISEALGASPIPSRTAP